MTEPTASDDVLGLAHPHEHETQGSREQAPAEATEAQREWAKAELEIVETRVLVDAARQRGALVYEWYVNPDDDTPIMRAIVQTWDTGAADVVLVRVMTNEAVAYRTPPRNDPFRPAHVTATAKGKPVQVIRDVLAWDDWGTESVIPIVQPAAPEFGLSLEFRLSHTEKTFFPRGGVPMVRPPMPMPEPLPERVPQSG